MPAKQYLRLIVISLIISLTTSVSAETATIAVASNFKSTAMQLKKAFEQQHPHQLRIVSASSGKLYMQIQQQAPFDIFLSADQQKPALLIKQGLVNENQAFTYAIGQLLLWSADPSLDVKSCLIEHCYTRLAMANAQYAPYGLAAKQTINALSLIDIPTQHIVTGENINQTLQFIQTGNVELGFIAASQLDLIHASSSAAEKNIWHIPNSLYSPIKQDAVWLKRSVNNLAAKDFWQFLQQTTAQKVISDASYQTISGAADS